MNNRRELTPAQIAWAIQERLKNPPTPWIVLTEELRVSRRRLQSLLPPDTYRIIPRGKSFTPEQCAEITKAYETEEGITVRALAERYHCCHQRICSMLKRAGIKTRKGGQSLGPNGKIVYPKAGVNRPKFSEDDIETDPRHAKINAAVWRARFEAGMHPVRLPSGKVQWVDGGKRRPSSMPLGLDRSPLADC